MIPHTPVHFLEFFDFISVGSLALILVYLVLDHKKNNGTILGTISQTVAHTPKSSVIFSIGMTIYFPVYYAFIYFWIGPRTQEPAVFYYLLILSALCEVIFVWVPALPGKKNLIHTIASSLVGVFMMFFPIIILVYSHNLSQAARYSIIGFIGLSFIMALLLLVKKLRRHSFAYETIYCVIFLICMSVIGHS